ncbi:hypothetical protein [Streptomyces alfalfae]
MGRKKPGKPRRQRSPQEYTLRQLKPPGEPYDEWFTVHAGSAAYRNDIRLNLNVVALMDRIQRLGPLYGGEVPKAAVYLDSLIDTGKLPIFQGEDEGTLVPIADMAAAHDGASLEEIRESIHKLHAVGALIVFSDDDHDVSYVRMVAKRPEEPGMPWQFDGDRDVAVATTCIPTHIWEDLPIDVAAAVAYMRTCRSRLEEPDPAVYGTHEGVTGTQHAKELFAAALTSGYVDEKGCDACPTGHLCTR